MSAETLLCLGWEPWTDGPQNSLAELLIPLARRGLRIIYVEPQTEWSKTSLPGYLAGMRAGLQVRRDGDFLILHSAPLPPLGIRAVPPLLRERWLRTWVPRAKGILAHQLHSFLLSQETASPILWITEPFDLYLAGKLGESRSCYYIYDEVGLIPGYRHLARGIAAIEKECLPHIDAVFATSHAQYEARRDLHPQVYFLPHGVDVGRFAPREGKPLPCPPDLDSIRRPRLGVVGQIDFRLDFALLEHLAKSRPDWSLVFVGPVRGSAHGQEQRLVSYPNVHFLGWRDPQKLPAYAQNLDAGLIPFQVTPATSSMTPLRMLTYLAAGVPTVSTPLPEALRLQPWVRVGYSAEALVEQVAEALREDSPLARAERVALAWGHSWEARAEEVLRLLGISREEERPRSLQPSLHGMEVA